MSCDTTGFGVMYLNSSDLSDLSFFDIKEATTVSRCVKVGAGGGGSGVLLDIVSTDMCNSPNQNGVCNLSMEPLRLVEWQELYLWSYVSQNISTHWQQDQCAINGQHQTCTSGYPD